MKDLEKYIEKKYMDLKFALLEKANKYVKDLISKLSSRGMLRSGALISGPYKIRKESLNRIFEERVNIEIDSRKKYGNVLDDSNFKVTQEKINKSIDVEFERLINDTKQDAKSARMDEDSFREVSGACNSIQHFVKFFIKNELGLPEHNINIKILKLET